MKQTLQTLILFGGLFADIDRGDLSDVLKGLSGILCTEGTPTGLAKRSYRK